jgi:hypothetical protein
MGIGDQVHPVEKAKEIMVVNRFASIFMVLCLAILFRVEFYLFAHVNDHARIVLA